MGRAALVTVPDEGAAWMVHDALTEAGIHAQVERAGAEHPYTANALARPMRIWVQDEQLDEARRVLAALQEELAGSDEELTAEALAAGRLQVESAPTPRERRIPHLSWAIALGLLLPIPVVCFYARAWRTGALFAGLYLAGLACALAGHPGLVLTPVSKGADLAVGIPLVILARRRAARAHLN
jgi:hypothetical protein